MAWNLANEPRCQGCDGDVMQAWIERTCAAFKKNAPNHLVGIGAEGFYGTDAPDFASDFNPGLGGSDWAAREGQDFLRNAATPCVDYAGVHVWPDDWNFPGTAFQRRFLEQRIAAIQNALPGGPKPFVLEEFGKTVQRTETAENALNSRGGRTTPTRVRYFESAYAVSEAAANAGALAGTLFWHWYDRGVGPGKYGVRSNDDAFRAVERHARAMNAIARVPESCAVSDENSDEAA
jgi:mannan endo-1,4-beta-mannosidase